MKAIRAMPYERLLYNVNDLDIDIYLDGYFEATIEPDGYFVLAADDEGYCLMPPYKVSIVDGYGAPE